MANANGSIDEIIGQEARKQIDDATAKMGTLLTTFKESVTAVNLMNDALNKAGSGGSGGLKKATNEFAEFEKVEKKLIETTRQYGTEINNLKVLTTQAAAQNKAQAQSTVALKGSYNELQANMQLLIAKYKALSAEMRSGAIGKGLQADIAMANKSLKDLDAGLGNMQRNVGNYGSALSKVWGGIRQLAYILPGLGIAGIFNLAGEAALALADKMDLFKKKVDDLGEALVKGQKDSTAEVVSLDHLYKKTQDVTLSIKERKAAVDKLQELYPNYFKNIKDEDLLIGKAKKLYDDLKDSIIATAKAKAIEGRMTEIINNGLDDEIRLKENARKASLEEKTNRGQPIAIRKFSGINKEWSTINMSPDEANAYRIEKKNIEQKQLDDFKAAQTAKLKVLEEGLNKEEKIINSKPSITPTNTPTTTKPKEVNRIDDAKKEYEEELKVAKTAYNNGLMSYLDYQLRLLEIAKDGAIARSKITKLTQKENESDADFQLRISETYSGALKGLSEVGGSAVKRLSDESKKNVADAAKNIVKDAKKIELAFSSFTLTITKDKASLKEWATALKEILDNASQAIIGLEDAITERRLLDIDKREKALKESNEKELRWIENSGYSSSEKEKQKQKLAAETELKQKKIDRDRVTALRKQAKLNRDISIIEIIANTSMAISRHLKSPYPINLVEMASDAVIGAAQIAKVLATPLPQYAKGRKGGKAEHAIVGEIGQEAIVTTDGKVTLTPSTPSLAYIPQGADVIPHNELIKNSAYVALARQGTVTTDKLQMALIAEFEKNTEKIDELINVTKSKNLTATYNGLGGFESYKQANIR